jgi:membrane-associated phospholipid phosphatase
MTAWKVLENKKKYALLFLGGLLFLGSSLWITITYVTTFETRDGFIPPDPLMEALPVRDVSTLIFFILYGSILVALFYCFQAPKLLLRLVYTFGFMYWIRTVCITLVPFNEPLDLIPLTDPFIERLGIYQVFIKRDLFFSGHFASVFIPFLLLREKIIWKWILIIACILIGVGVMVQRIHFSYDVIGAAIFTYLAYVLAGKTLDVLSKD